MVFLDTNNLFSQRKLRVHLHEKSHQKERLKKQIEKINLDMHDLTTNPKSLEKFAREKYLMKKENEIKGYGQILEFLDKYLKKEGGD